MKKAIRIIYTATLVLASLVAVSQNREIDAQNAVVSRSKERLREIDRLNEALTGDISRSQQSLNRARSTIKAKQKIADELSAETNRLSTELDAGRRDVSKLDGDLKKLKSDYGTMVYTAWKSHKTSDVTLFLLSSRDFNDASRRISFIRRYNRARERQGARIDSLTRSLQAEMEVLSAKKTEVEGLQTESKKLLRTLADEKTKYEKTIKTLGAKSKNLKAEADKERKKIEAAQREITRIMDRQAKAARGKTLSEADLALSGRFGDNKGRLPWPTGAPGLILHHFGKEKSADGIESDFKGLIIAASPGSEVRAVFEGTVTWISDLGQYDKCVMVRSGEYVVGYGNIAVPAVKTGDKVSLHQSLGRLGNSNNPDRHLVLVWMQQGDTVLDPEQWLR
ncbi:MAG: peptidoglycan DD-metalloendopeptidase family protein [Alistipes sp.]|jgi:septal ring factor EnvC (AmiA/AmiB activator)|nr:peptidoglycan DD-metalloendopeptidase family protein [Alistipes sp.]